jgi:hypothetical protein
MPRREYQAGRPTTLTAALPIGGSSFTIAIDINWPDGADYDFWVTIDAGTAQEERILCSARTGTTVTVASGGRGQDGTAESNHAIGAAVWPSWSATDADEANEHINLASNVHGLATAGPSSSSGGSVVGTTGQQTLTNKTLTSPTINSATLTGTVTNTSTISGGTLSAVSLSGTTTATSGTIALGTNASAITANSKTISATEIGYLDGVTSAIQTQINNSTPVGSIVMWAHTSSSNVPTGWLLCNGQSTASYTALAAVVGANVPDLRGRVPVGFSSGDDAFGTYKGTGGSKTSTAAHTHGIDHDHAGFNTTGGEGAHAHDVNGSTSGTNTHDHGAGSYEETAAQGIGSDGSPSIAASILSGAARSAGAHNHNIDIPAFTGTSGGSSAGATNGNLQPYLSINFIIKT